MNEETAVAKNEQVAEEKEIQTTAQRVLSIVNITVNSIFYVFIFILLMFSISQIVGSKADKVTSVFGLGYESVQSDSMWVSSKNTWPIIDESRHKNKSDSFKKGDLIWVNTLSGSQKRKLKVGDVATFWDTRTVSKGFLNTHRVVDIVYDSNGKASSYIMQGDVYRGSAYDYVVYSAANASDGAAKIQMELENAGYVQIITTEAIRAKYTGKWENGGSFVDWLSNPKKGFVVVILFAGAFLLFEMFMVIKNVMELKTEKMGNKAEEDKQALKDEMKKSLEEERERMRAELLAELQASQAQKSDAKDEDVEEAASKENDIENSAEEMTEGKEIEE